MMRPVSDRLMDHERRARSSVLTWWQSSSNDHAQSDEARVNRTNRAPQAMRSFPLSTRTVFVAGPNAIAKIFSDNHGTILNNPFPSNQFGLFFFYVTIGSAVETQLSGARMITCSI